MKNFFNKSIASFKDNMAASSQALLCGERGLRKEIMRNVRRMSHATKGHLSPTENETRICLPMPQSLNCDELEQVLAVLDTAYFRTVKQLRHERRTRRDRKRGKVRATASRMEKDRMLKGRVQNSEGRIHDRVVCPKYGRAKVLFKSRECAERYADVENSSTRAGNLRKLFAYHCDACCGWHISSLDKYRIL